MKARLAIISCLLSVSILPACSIDADQQKQDKLTLEQAEYIKLSEKARSAVVTEKLAANAAASATESARLAEMAEANPDDESLRVQADAEAEKTETLLKKAEDGAAVTASAASGTLPFVENSQWQGFGFGIGASLTWDPSGNNRVGEVSLDENDIVRIDEEDDALARIVLETHYFGNCDTYIPDLIGQYFKDWLQGGGCGVGPFVAIQPGESDIIDAIGTGLMVGFQRPNQPADDNTSFNLGLGVIVDPNARVLGNDVKEDATLPDGETKIRTRKEAELGILFLASFAFN